MLTRGVLGNRLPARQDMVPVYAVVAFFIYGWTFAVYLWKLPSWMQFLTLGEIFSIFAYAIALNLLESLILLLLIVLVIWLLPSKVLKDNFIVRGTWLAFSILTSMMLVTWLYTQDTSLIADNIVFWIIGSVVFSILLFYLPGYWAGLSKVALIVSDRLVVFLFITLPLSVLSTLVVIIRNIF